MINSNQVNAMMMQQTQQQQMLGMGAPQAVVGQSQFPPQFNFGTNPLMGGRLSGAGGMGGMMASGVSGMGTALGVGSTAAMVGSMFGVGGASFGGLAGLALGNPLSAGLMAAGAGVGAVGNAMNTGIQTNNKVGQMLSASNFANPNAPGGFGFGFGDQARMTRSVLGMGASNAFVNTQDQTKLMGSFQQMGLDRGVTSMGKMIEKFKEFSKTTEDVATQLGKTVTEVTGLVQNLRGGGFYSASEVSGMSQKMSASASYGINMEQQQQMVQSMGQQARGMGLQRSTGGVMGVNMAQMFGAAGQTGVIGDNAMLSLTGATNTADAATALAQQFGGRFGGTMAGGGVMEKLLAGFTTVGSDGSLSIDESTMAGVSSGRIGFDALRSKTSSMAGGKNKAKFETSKRRLASEFLKSEQGMGAILGTFRGMASDRAQGGDMSEEEAFTLLMKQYQLADEEESKMLYDMSTNIDQLMSKNTKNKLDTMASEKRRAYLAKHRSFSGMKRKAGHELKKIYDNPFIAERTATASSAFDAGISAIERDFFGIQDNKSGLFTEASTTDFYDSFMSGDLNDLKLGGTEADPFKRAMASRVGDLSKYEEFGSFLSGSLTDEGRSNIKGKKLDANSLESFKYHTEYVNRDKDTVMTTHTISPFTSDAKLDYQGLIDEAKSKGAKSDQEAMAMIAQQSPEAAAALQRYMGREGDLASTSLQNLAEDSFIGQATGGGGYGYGSTGAMTGATGLAAVAGLALSGASIGAAGFGVGAIVGGAIGLGYGIMKMGDEREFQGQLKGSAGNLLAKLSTKKKLKDFDKLYQKELLSNGGDTEAAKQSVAKKLSEDMGEAVSAEDVGASLKALTRSSGGKGYEARLKGNYSGALKMTKAAGRYQKTEIAMGHIEEMRDQLLGEDVEGLEGLQSALASSGGEVVGKTQEQLLELVKKAATGEFTYDGDNEILKAVADTKGLTDQFSKLAGGSLEDIDSAFNQKGMGKRLRKMAGIRKGGSLSEKELKKMAQVVAGQNVLALTTSDAKQGMADAAAGAGGDEVVKATTTLLNSSAKLAVYVDNIASVLTGNEVAGKKIPGLDEIDIRRER